MERPIKFDFLQNHPRWVGAAARLWMDNIGGKWYPQNTFIQTYERFQAQLNSDKLPLATIAHNGRNLIGFCNLGEDFDLGVSYSPWLGALVVDKYHQNKGIGTQLMNYAIDIAANMGVSNLYLFTIEPTIPEFYAERGWSYIRPASYKGIPAKIMRKSLKQRVVA